LHSRLRGFKRRGRRGLAFAGVSCGVSFGFNFLAPGVQLAHRVQLVLRRKVSVPARHSDCLVAH